MNDPVHGQKVRFLRSQGMEQCGIVMSQPDNDKTHANDVAIVWGAAVRWMPRDEFWLLMHPPQDDGKRSQADAEKRWAAFGRAVMAQHKDGDCGDVDGGWLQETGVQTGVLQIVEAKEPCAEEGCMCAATCGDWPVDCYRVVTP